MTRLKDVAGNNSTLLCCPGFPIWVDGARILDMVHIWAFWVYFPAVIEFHQVLYHRMTPCSEIIICISIVVSTDATYLSLKVRAELYVDGGLGIPNDEESINTF